MSENHNTDSSQNRQEIPVPAEHHEINVDTEASPKNDPFRVCKKNKRKKVSFSPFALVLICAFAVILTAMITYLAVAQSYLNRMLNSETDTGGLPTEAYAKLSQIAEIMGSEFLYDIDEEVLTESIIKGYMYGTGDRYAEYFTKEEFDILMSDTNGEMQGIGISVATNTDYNAIQVISVFPDSPAFEAGVLPGDLIAYVFVDGEAQSVSSLGYTMAMNELRGEAGTKAEFIVYRGEDLSETVEFSIERGFITEYTVTHRVYEADTTIGIIEISSFDYKTPEQFQTALNDLTDAGCKKIVIDVRNNPGGELNSVCQTLDMLVPEGPVIRTVDKAGNEEVVYTSDKNETNIPLAVLTNGNTASAGELFAACLRDYDKAILIGETTFGKGSMQTTMQFYDGTAFKYTYRYYCPPTSDNYDGVGIKPDVEIKLTEEELERFYILEDSEDRQLVAAVNELNK